MKSSRDLELIIPVFNEATVLQSLFDHLDAAFSLPELKRCGLSGVRFLFIDDGSTDQTASILAKRIRSGWPAGLIRLSRNFGHQAALTAGLDRASASLVGILDADLQDPPELILEMVRKLGEGFDIVYGQRRSRQGPVLKRFMYWGLYRLYKLFTGINLPMDTGDFCVMKSQVVRALGNLPEKQKFHRGLRSWVGFRQTGFLYDRPERVAGASKYDWAHLYTLATNGIASLSIRPLRVTQGVLFFSLTITVSILTLTLLKFLQMTRPDPFWTLLLTTQTMITFTSSLQIFCLYILGAYVGRTYLEVKSRPPYIVMETIERTESETAE